jgi:hypothetical protein
MGLKYTHPGGIAGTSTASTMPTRLATATQAKSRVFAGCPRSAVYDTAAALLEELQASGRQPSG